MSTTTPAGKTSPEDRLADLQGELAGIDDVIRAARQAFDADGWMRATLRAEQLPEEIHQARGEVLHARLEDAWDAVDQALAAEATAAEELKARAADPACRLLSTQLHEAGVRFVAGLPDNPALQAELAGAAEVATARRRQAEADLQEAKIRTDRAFHAVEQVELQMDSHSIPVPDGHGIRARPQPLARTVAGRRRHPLALVSDVGPFTPGTTPPRWIAHRLDPRFWQPRATPQVPTTLQARRDPHADQQPGELRHTPTNATETR